jgi:hypothetical protein
MSGNHIKPTVKRTGVIDGANPVARPVQLQANVAGAWKTVLRFDAGNDADVEKVQLSVGQLFEVDGGVSWRIVTTDRVPLVLRHLGRNTYGLWIDRRLP